MPKANGPRSWALAWGYVKDSTTSSVIESFTSVSCDGCIIKHRYPKHCGRNAIRYSLFNSWTRIEKRIANSVGWESMRAGGGRYSLFAIGLNSE